MIEPRLAIVRPRIVTDDGSSLLLEDEIADRLGAQSFGIVALVGPPYSGKHTALRHLAAVFADDPRLVLVDRPIELSDNDCAKLFAAKPGLLLLFSSPGSTNRWTDQSPLRLAPWGEDEWIEYLLATRRERCASVIGRLRGSHARAMLGRSTLLHRLVLDAMSDDESLVDVSTTLHRETVRRLGPALPPVAAAMFSHLIVGGNDDGIRSALKRSGAWTPETNVLLQQATVRLMLAAEHVVERLRDTTKMKILRRPLPRPLLGAVAPRLRDDPVLVARLRATADGQGTLEQAMAASLIHAAGEAWRPVDDSAPNLCRAVLPGIRWSGMRLRYLFIDDADLSGSDLSESQWADVLALRTVLRDADLNGAKLDGFYARHADFSGARLTDVRGESCVFEHARFCGANLEGASLPSADFDKADLRGASFRRADLKTSSFRRALVEGADFTGADLSRADLSDLDLRRTELVGTNFRGACLDRCNLARTLLPGAQFSQATFLGADLTASEMPHADFSRAAFAQAGLAEVEWEDVDLRNADLRGATFHMGSSRSGLCANPPASEGTRTGFYTDDYEEQGFKSPEEIRKANLCGADLRGALLDGVDFYLVDLRGARYTPSQELHLRRSGAILESRV